MPRWRARCARRLRKDFHNFPEFEGEATHYPFRTVSVRGERYRARD